jgi:hypothetical protein
MKIENPLLFNILYAFILHTRNSVEFIRGVSRSFGPTKFQKSRSTIISLDKFTDIPISKFVESFTHYISDRLKKCGSWEQCSV